MTRAKPTMIALWVLATTILVVGAADSHECGECNFEECPDNCISRVEDPCGCCIDGLCAGNDGDPCSTALPCSEELYCDTSIDGGVCTCKQDKRKVCGSDGVTYNSICDLNIKSHAGLRKWGVCDTQPGIASAPSNQKLEIGQPLTLDCEVKGYPVPSIEWHFVGKNGQSKILPGDDQMTAIQLRGGPETLMVTSWVQIVSLRESDEGLYTCMGTNIHGYTKAEAYVSIQK